MVSLLKKPIFWLTTLPLLAAIAWLIMLPQAPTTAQVDPAEYRVKIQADRAKKDADLRTTADSPILDKANFKGLTYFEADPAFRVLAKLEPFPVGKAEKLVVKLTDGTEDIYEKYAHANFTLGNKTGRLLVLKFQSTLTILFQDSTSGQETYGGGRYIDLDQDAIVDNQVIVDFNAAYNPYCAYSPTYACPLPPPENKLAVAVKAGERHQHE